MTLILTRRQRPLQAAALCCALGLGMMTNAAAFEFPGSSMPGMSSGIPGFSGPFSGMPGGMPGMGSGMPGMGGLPGMGSGLPGMGSGMPGMGGLPGMSSGLPGMGSGLPGMGSGLPGFSRVFPDFSFDRNTNRPQNGSRTGPWSRSEGRPERARKPYQYLPDWLGKRVRPGAGAVIYDMAFVQDRSFKRMRMIVVQTSTTNGMLAQRCVQYSLAPVMSCQAHIGGNASKNYMMPAPATSPLHETMPTTGNGMSFSSKGRWRDMTVYGRFQYIAGRQYF